MREPILKAVAMPPRLFLAPFSLAAANFVVQIAWMFLLIGVFDVNPLFSVGAILLAHMGLVVAGAREPHLARMLECWGKSGPAVTHNIYPERGVKLAP